MSFLIDTHCHIHDPEFAFDAADVFKAALDAGVRQLICIGISAEDSQRAVGFAKQYQGVWATVGLHPHDAVLGEDDFEVLARLVAEPKVVAIGECGLDYHYNNSPRDAQIRALEYQLELAASSGKPCSFHVREAFDDFWPVFDTFTGIKGVLHSFTDSRANAEEALKRGLLLGFNGILTFKNSSELREVAASIPPSQILLETDAPFLTPLPLRGTINVPAHVRLVAACLAEVRGETLAQLIEATTRNARQLFGLDPSELLA